MERKEVLQAIKTVRENSKKRNFTESFDLVINLKGLNIKKEEEKINSYVNLPHLREREVRITALVGQELSTKAKEACNNTILLEDFQKQDKPAIKKLAKKTEFFIAQADIMPKVAATFGRVLGQRGQMPNPKAGCIVPSTGEIKPIVEKLKRTAKIETKNEQVIKTSIGLASMDDEKLADNAMAVYNTVISVVPQEKNNIKNIILKLSMGRPLVVGKKMEAPVTKIETKKENVGAKK